LTLPLAALLLALAPSAPAAHATRTAQAPQIDGRLGDAAWKTAPPITDFVQHYPKGDAATSERTTLRILYDDEALYFAFDCEQVRSPIIERLTRRDRDVETEWASVRIDPKNEGKVALTFSVSVAGVLADALITEPANWHMEWDEIWEARTARSATGWTAELRIPFRVLRFDASDLEAGWSIQASRYVAQEQEVDMWPALPRDVGNPLVYFGRLDGLQGIKPGGVLELRPFVTGQVRRLDPTDRTSASGYDARAALGLDAKVHLTPALTLDVALLPDFGQVEADQVILNLTNYETFLPEKRPLFLEGADVFAFPLQVFYSRRVGIAPTLPTLRSADAVNGTTGERLVNLPEPAPIYSAAKVVGRIARSWTVGALAAVTGRNQVTIEDGAMRVNRVLAPVTTQTALRLKRDWAGTGHVGLMATGATTFDGSSNATACPSANVTPVNGRCFRDSYVAGVDALWRSPSGDYVANGALIGSLVHGGPNTRQLDGTIIGPGAYAPGGWLRLAKDGGKHLLASLSYQGAGRRLDYNDLGYMQRQNLHELTGAVGYRTLDPGTLTLETSTELKVTQRRSLSGLDLGQVYSLSTFARLSSFWRLWAAADAAPRRFDDREVGNGTALERGGYLGGRAGFESDQKRAVVVSVEGQAQAIQGGAQMVSATGSLTLIPLPQFELVLEPQIVWSAGEFRYTGISENVYGKLEATSVGAILRANYTFAPHLSLQAYAQGYLAAGRFEDLHQLAAPANQKVTREALAMAPTFPTPTTGATTPDFEQAALNVNVVFRWEYLPGSTLFLVYTRSQMPEILLAPPPAMLQPSALGRRASSDVIMLKLTYWWAS
jgi:hypothetical protein